MKFLHATIRVKDIEKSLAFYEDLLDMNLTEQMRLDDCNLYFLSDDDGQTQIELVDNDETPAGGYSSGENFGHFAFGTENLDEFYKKMQKYGYDWEEAPFVLKDYDMKIAFIKDPDNNMIEIIEI